MKIRKIVFGILAILWMTVIFAYSSRTGEESEKDSYDVGYMLGRMVVPAFDTWTSEEQLEFAENVDHPIRKTAHFIEYMLLGILITGVCYDGDRDKRYCIIFSWAIASLYAASDEIHQFYVSERSGQLSDVLLDSSGALAGVLVSIAAVYLYKHFKNKV